MLYLDYPIDAIFHILSQLLCALPFNNDHRQRIAGAHTKATGIIKGIERAPGFKARPIISILPDISF